MKAKLIIVFACIVLFLGGCASLECEITHCGQKCVGSRCKPPKCPSCQLRQYHPQDTFRNNGAASYDSYVVNKPKPCGKQCQKAQRSNIYKGQPICTRTSTN